MLHPDLYLKEMVGILYLHIVKHNYQNLLQAVNGAGLDSPLIFSETEHGQNILMKVRRVGWVEVNE